MVGPYECRVHSYEFGDMLYPFSESGTIGTKKEYVFTTIQVTVLYHFKGPVIEKTLLAHIIILEEIGLKKLGVRFI